MKNHSFLEHWVSCGEYKIHTKSILIDRELPTIILSGPASTCIEHYKTLMKQLGEFNYNVIAFDMPGHGRTLKGNRPHRGDFRAKDLEKTPFVVARYVREGLQIKGPLILLLSSLSAIYGIRGLAKDKEGLYDIAFFHCLAENRKHIERFLNKRNILLFRLLLTVFFPLRYWPLKNLLNHFLFIPLFVRSSDMKLQAPFPQRFFREIKMTGWAIRKVLDPSITHFFTFESWRSLIEVDNVDFRRIMIPVYALSMEKDALFTEEMAKEFSQNLPKAKLVRMKGGHLLFAERGPLVEALAKRIDQIIRMQLGKGKERSNYSHNKEKR